MSNKSAPTDIEKIIKRIKKSPQLFIIVGVAVLLLCSSTAGALYLRHESTERAKAKAIAYQNSLATSQTTATPVSYTNLQANEIVALINQARTNQNLAKLNYLTTLTNAAQARAQYMATNNVYNNTTGFSASDITNYGYDENGYSFNFSWGFSSNQLAANHFITGSDSLGLTTTYSDIGVGVAQAVISGVNEDIVVVMVANQATSSSGGGSSTINPNDLPDDTPTDTTCPTGELGYPPDCYFPNDNPVDTTPPPTYTAPTTPTNNYNSNSGGSSLNDNCAQYAGSSAYQQCEEAQ